MLFNLEAEINVLGSILKDENSICKVIDLIEPNDFYNNAHKLIYSELRSMYEQSKPIDLTTLAESLGSRLVEVGGLTYLSNLLDTLSTKNIKAYAEIIKNKSTLRTLQQNLTLAQKQIDSEADPNKIISFLQNNTMTFSTKEENGDTAPAVEDFMNDLEARYKNGGDINGTKTHFTNLDDILGGLHPQDFIIVGARPSMGKSVMATNLTTNIALRSKKKVALFSLEMNNVSLVKRMVSKLARIDSYDLRDGNINDKQWMDISKASNMLVTDNIKLYEVTMSLNKIIAECKRLKIQNGLDVVIIDYLQLIQGLNKENRNQEISDISRKLKLLAKELNITVIALSQLSRNVESRPNKRPTLSDLRESGSIEQDADVVMFLYRDEYYNPETEDKGMLETIIAKQRDGETGTVKLAWLPQFQTIGNIDYIHEGTFREDAFKGGK